MPAPPELFDRTGEIRMVKVLGKPDTEKSGSALTQADTGVKIRLQLQAVHASA